MCNLLKKLFVIIIIVSSYINPVSAVVIAGSSSTSQTLFESELKIRNVLNNVRKNFKNDSTLFRYLYQNYSTYQMQRIIERDTIFPKTNNLVKGYNKIYPEISTEYVLKQDKKKIDNYKEITIEYCKYNSYKFKDKSVCSKERIDSLFSE